MTGQERIGAAALLIAGVGAALVAGLPSRPAMSELAAVSVTLPDDDAVALPGPVAGSCTGCHSAAMITNQPPLGHDGWAAIVKKMREVYKAPIADAQVPAIVDHLTALSAAQHPGT